MSERNRLAGYRLVAPPPGNLRTPEDAHYPTINLAGWFLDRSLGRITKEDPTTEDVAAHHLWWRVALLFHDSLALIGTEAVLAMSFVSRAMSECILHIEILVRNESRAEGGRSPFDKLRMQSESEVLRHRLRGYLTWLLSNELWALRQGQRPKVLRAMFEPDTARKHAVALAEMRERFPQISGLFEEPETLTDAEAEQEKRQHLASRKRDIIAHPVSPDTGLDSV